MLSSAANHPLAAPAATNGAGAHWQLCPPTKLLGCLRAVGRPTSKTNPLLVAAVFTAAGSRISRVDLKLVDVATGATVAQMDRQGNGHFGSTGGLLCNVGSAGHAAVSVFDPATCDVTNIPAYANGNRTSSALLFGHVPATGEHKILRVYRSDELDGARQSCEILTLASGGGEVDEQQRWRPAPSPPVRVDTLRPMQRVVTAGGVAHFLIPRSGADYDGIASFDMATEEWGPALLRAPLPDVERHCCSEMLILTELNGYLAFVHHDYRAYAVDMWVLWRDGRGSREAWLRADPVPLGKVLRGGNGLENIARPVMVLEDGRIAFWVRAPNAVLRLYDPRTGDCEEVADFGRLCSLVGFYRGTILGLD